MKHMEQIRRVLLYKYFITHYIEMSKALLKFNAWNQILMYLKQSTRLCTLLIGDGYEVEAQIFLSRIDRIHRELMSSRSHDSKFIRPELPFRQGSIDNSQIKTSCSNKATDMIAKNSASSPLGDKSNRDNSAVESRTDQISTSAQIHDTGMRETAKKRTT